MWETLGRREALVGLSAPADSRDVSSLLSILNLNWGVTLAREISQLSVKLGTLSNQDVHRSVSVAVQIPPWL